MPNTEDYWLFGDSFLRGYYSVFNLETGKLGLAPHVDSDKSVLEPGKTPPNYLTGGTNLLAWTVSGIVIAIMAWIFIVYINPLIDDWLDDSGY